MANRHIMKILKKEYTTKKRSNSSHDIILVINNVEYYVKIFNTTSNMQVSINSKYMWELSKGRINGIRFIKYSSKLIDLRGFIKNEKRIIILSNKPYKILKQINESDIEDVSSENSVHSTFITSNPLSIPEII